MTYEEYQDKIKAVREESLAEVKRIRKNNEELARQFDARAQEYRLKRNDVINMLGAELEAAKQRRKARMARIEAEWLAQQSAMKAEGYVSRNDFNDHLRAMYKFLKQQGRTSIEVAWGESGKCVISFSEHAEPFVAAVTDTTEEELDVLTAK